MRARIIKMDSFRYNPKKKKEFYRVYLQVEETKDDVQVYHCAKVDLYRYSKEYGKWMNQLKVGNVLKGLLYLDHSKLEVSAKSIPSLDYYSEVTEKTLTRLKEELDALTLTI